MEWLWQHGKICTPLGCTHGGVPNPVAGAVLLLLTALGAFPVAARSRGLRIMMVLVGGRLVGFAHHILIAHFRSGGLAVGQMAAQTVSTQRDWGSGSRAYSLPALRVW
jgi:hypothetical protein